MTTTFVVKGMTCGHCVSTVTTELSALPGVTAVDVDLDSGEVKVASDIPVDRTAVREALDEAGFELVDAP